MCAFKTWWVKKPASSIATDARARSIFDAFVRQSPPSRSCQRVTGFAPRATHTRDTSSRRNRQWPHPRQRSARRSLRCKKWQPRSARSRDFSKRPNWRRRLSLTRRRHPRSRPRLRPLLPHRSVHSQPQTATTHCRAKFVLSPTTRPSACLVSCPAVTRCATPAAQPQSNRPYASRRNRASNALSVARSRTCPALRASPRTLI